MTLHCEVHGNGADLVLLHGWGMNAAVWDDVAADLAKHFRVHCVDLPGYGNSSISQPYTLAGITDALAAVMPQPAVICGWSLGGQVALNWALHAPRQVERLVLIATTPRFVNGAQWESGIDAVMFEGLARDLADDYRATLQRFLGLQAQDDADARAVLRRLRGMMLKRGEPVVAALAAGLQILKETDLRDSLPQISQPALILHGARDAIVPLAAGVYLQRTLPRAVLEVCAGAAHAPFVACPRRAAQRIVEFCRER
jgi:pimeloyl-[acyl-carrier protein] methyl ester esterase